MTHNQTIPQNPHFAIYSHALTQKDNEALRQLSHDASGFLGRTVSDSAIVRALIRQVSHQGLAAADTLFFQVGEELKNEIRQEKQNEK
jgi:anionic cell wall polymer biosynthesis LytR-Cps2A-Psr (LCP) family protein